MAKLVVNLKERDSQVYQLTASVTYIGRGDDAHLLLPDVSVSRRHCCVRQTDDGYELKDMGSSNGTLLNGRKMQCKPIEHGDRIQVGKFLLVFDNPASDTEVTSENQKLEQFNLDDERPGFLARVSAVEGPTAQSTSRLDSKGLKAARIAARLAQDARICTMDLDEKEYTPGDGGIRFGGQGLPVKGLGMGAKVRIAWNGKAHILMKEGGLMTRVEINGDRIKSQELKLGDELTIGRSAFVYKLAGKR
jgi:pSer/pThr/pTyr-binding forkhead associated (FHA) protein